MYDVLKMKRFILLTFLLISFFACDFAYARCIDYLAGSKEEAAKDQEILDKAFFAGKVRVEKIEGLPTERGFLGQMKYSVTMTPVQTYKGSLPPQTKVIFDGGHEIVGPGKMGHIYERLVFKDGDRYKSTDWCVFFSETGWAALRNKAEMSAEFELINSDCLQNGGEIAIYNAEIYCKEPASDAGQECNDSLQCEGLCVVDTEGMDYQRKFDLETSSEWTDADKFAINSGVCTLDKNPKGEFVELNEQGQLMHRWVE